MTTEERAAMIAYLGDMASTLNSDRFDALNEADELRNLDDYPVAAQFFLMALAQMDQASHMLQLARLHLSSKE